MERSHPNNSLADITDRAVLALRSWAYANPEACAPEAKIEKIAEGSVPADGALLTQIALDDDRLLAAQSENGTSDPDTKPAERIARAIFRLIRKRLWEEWDMIVGERELLDDMDDLD